MNEETLNKLKKEFFKQLIATYVAKTIDLEFRTYGNDGSRSYNCIFHSCLNNYKLNKKDREAVFDSVDQILLNQYELLIANAGRKESLYLVDLKKEDITC